MLVCISIANLSNILLNLFIYTFTASGLIENVQISKKIISDKSCLI